MHDYWILYADRERAAVEVTAAADALMIATWNAAEVHGGMRWIIPELAGGWSATVGPGTNMKRLRKELPPLLRAFESAEISESRPDISWQPGPYDAAVRALGIVHLFQSGTDILGSVYPIPMPAIDRRMGYIPADGGPLVDWLNAWLIRSDQADNMLKLAASGAEERHLFLVVPSFADAPFSVVQLLTDDTAPLPDNAPVLPREVTHVWAACTWARGFGMRWDPQTGWMSFAKALSDETAPPSFEAGR